VSFGWFHHGLDELLGISVLKVPLISGLLLLLYLLLKVPLALIILRIPDEVVFGDKRIHLSHAHMGTEVDSTPLTALWLRLNLVLILS
jgi:hypothetical protein